MQAALLSANGDPLVALETTLGERNTLSSQNSQLWKIIEKQRGMYNSLHKELDRVKAERDRLQTKSSADTPTKRLAAGESTSRKQLTRSQSEDRRKSQYSVWVCTFSPSLERDQLQKRSPHATVRISPADMFILLLLALMAVTCHPVFSSNEPFLFFANSCPPLDMGRRCSFVSIVQGRQASHVPIRLFHSLTGFS